MESILGAVVGMCVGSFMGVVVDRSNIKDQKSKIFEGRSKCTSCRRQLRWWENIPIISYIFLGGRCRTCRSPIPYWLPLIELVGAAAGLTLSVTQIGRISLIGLIGLILIAAALIWIFFSDLVYGTVPDAAILIGSVGAVIYRLPFTVYGLLWPAAAAAGFFYLLVLITRRRGMGIGDVTLAFFIGLWLGWPLILAAVWVAFLAGSLAAGILLVTGKKKFGQTIPFGPFLIGGSLVALKFGNQVISLFRL